MNLSSLGMYCLWQKGKKGFAAIGATGRNMGKMNEEWLETVMGLMAAIITAVYSNEERVEKEQERE